jgi:hypothetical protein
MWWNFVARTPQEIADARTDWEERRRFGEVTGYSGPRLAAPSLVKLRIRTPLVDLTASHNHSRAAPPPRTRRAFVESLDWPGESMVAERGVSV